MLSAAKHLRARRARSFASLRMTSGGMCLIRRAARGDVLDPSRSQGGQASAAGSPKVPANCVILVVYISRVLHSYSGYFYEELCD
jgi:hypothetical protein